MLKKFFSQLSQINLVIPIIVFLIGLFLTFFITKTFKENQITQEKDKLKHEIVLLEQSLNVAIRKNATILKGLKGLFVASDNVEPDEWEKYIANFSISSDYPEIQSLEFIKYVRESEKEKFLKTEKEKKIDFNIYPITDQKDYFIINYVTPNDGREERLGLDLGVDAGVRESLEKVRKTGEMVLSRPSYFIKNGNKEGIIILYIPVYENGVPISTIEERENAFIGSIAGIFDIDLFVGEMAKMANKEQFSFKIRDILDDEDFLYEYSTFAKHSKYCSYHALNKMLLVFDRNWEVDIKRENCAIFWRESAIKILFLGIVITILVTLLLFYILRSKTEALILAKKITIKLEERKTSLEQLNRKLAVEIIDKRKAEKNLEKKIEEMEKLNDIMVGREMKIIELKNKLKEIK